MSLGRSVRIYLAEGKVGGIRHGEIVNWTGQAIACPRSRLPELKEWEEVDRPGVYFLFGQNEESGQDSVYIGEAEIVADRVYAHLAGKEFWSDLVTFTSKDDNLTKGHVRYLESRLVQLATVAGRYEIENSAEPQLPALPRSDRDAMEEFIDGIRILLGVLGHRVLDPLVARPIEPRSNETVTAPSVAAEVRATATHAAQVSAQLETFQIRIGSLIATAVRTDEGLVVRANSEAATTVAPSLSGGYRALRERLLQSGVLVESGGKLKFVRDQLFRSPSQAAAVVVGYSINGREAWKTPSGITFSDFEDRLARSN